MEAFDHILNWKLKRGSHQFPGKDGGTCINEAALIAAGFEYRPIHDASQMPGCFSCPICHFAMMLNDRASDGERQLLLPFVTRLACADRPEVERERAAYIAARVTSGMTLERGIQILEGALAIGRQAEPLTLETVRASMEAVKDKAETATSVPGHFFTKLKAWFAAEKVVEPAT